MILARLIASSNHHIQKFLSKITNFFVPLSPTHFYIHRKGGGPVNPKEQAMIRKAIAKRVFDLSKSPHAKDKRILFRELYSSLNLRYRVGSYKEIKSSEFKSAMKFIQTWEGLR